MAAFLQNASKNHRIGALAGIVVIVFLALSFLGGSSHLVGARDEASLSSSSGTLWSSFTGSKKGYHPQRSLAYKVEQAEVIYQRTVDARHGLVKKLGPVKNVHAFPDTSQDPLHRLYMLWDWLPPSWPCPHEVERVGVIGDGGKFVCGVERLVEVPNCVIYSFGVEQQSSFEAELLKRSPSCSIWAYDFSVKSIGPEIKNDPALNPRVKFTPYRFDDVNLQASKDNPETHTLDYIMKENGHTFIDLLKVDIEGSEFAVLKQIVDHAKGQPLPFAQLQLEIHAWFDEKDVMFADYLEWWELLESAGLRPFYRELNYQSAMTNKIPNVIEYSFVNTRAPSYIISDKMRSA